MTISKHGKKLSEIDMSIINTINAIAYLYFLITIKACGRY